MATVRGKPGGTVVGGGAGVVGAKAERAVARILNKAPAGIWVGHDLNIPNSPANIDHAVIVGNTLWLIDTKAWSPGWYVTIGGRTWRNWKPWVDGNGSRPADKLTLPMARDRLRPLLPADTKIRCVMTVRSSSKHGDCRLGLYRPRDATKRSIPQLEKWVTRMKPEPADPGIVTVMERHLR